MARGQLALGSADGGLGNTGPLGAAVFGLIGVASEAEAIADQLPVVVSSVADVETLVGHGPLRDALAVALAMTGTSVLAMPLERSTGGAVLGTAARTSGSMRVTAVAGYTLKGGAGREVILRWAVGGQAPTAALQLVVDGVALPSWAPAAADYGSPLTIPAASGGNLLAGVAVADQFKPTVTQPDGTTPAVVGDQVTFQFGEPRALAANTVTALTKISEHEFVAQWVGLCGTTLPATQAALHVEARRLTGLSTYLHVHAQALGPSLITGATTVATTPAYVSALVGATAPARLSDPRLTVWANFWRGRDPITNEEITVPAMYPAMGKIAQRQSWEPPDEVGQDGYGELGTEGNRGEIYPLDMTGAQIDTLDDAYYATLQTHQGRTGVFITHGRLFGAFPSGGVPGTDYTGTERRRGMDEALRSVFFALLPRVNSRIPTDGSGRMSVAARNDWAGVARSALARLESVGFAVAPQVEVTDEDPGILQTDTVIVRVSFIPDGKAARIEGTVEFRRSTAQTEEAA